MYTTRALSQYKNSPEIISLPPEGPNSGYLVLKDEESMKTSCFGLRTDPSINHLPFPQNKCLSIEYNVQTGRTSSKEEHMETCCFCTPSIRDVKPRPFDPDDLYQQFEFSEKPTRNTTKLEAKSVAPDGHPPYFLRRDRWQMNAKPLKHSTLEEARGIDSSLRAHLPDLSFTPSQECSKSVVVGKWYCPFIFIRDGKEKDQIKQSVFYEMTLEQRWERIFTAETGYNNQGNKGVTVDVVVPTELVRIGGQQAVQTERYDDDRGAVWFKTIDGRGGQEQVGLSCLIVERIMWEEERVGWVKGKEKQVRVVKEEEYGGIGEWRRFGCYVLVETFVLKRNDGSVLLTYDFRHTHQIRAKWE